VGQKIHPKGLRIGIVKGWDSRWYANKADFSVLLVEDVKVRKYVKKALFNSGVSKIEIERAANRLKVIVHTAKPGMVIGKQGAGITDLQKVLETMTGRTVSVNVVEVRLPELDAQLVAENIAQQLEKRIAFRRAVKQSIQKTMRMGAKGIRIGLSGRIGGAEIARREGAKDGTVPLHTLRADIDYGFAEATTTYGKIGVKCWLFAGDRSLIPTGGGGRGGDRGGDRGGRGGDRGGRGGARGGARGPSGPSAPLGVPGGGPAGTRPQSPRPAAANDRAAIAAGPKPANREGGRS
jgi:small subunit ribosomal protein S3